MRVDNYLWSPHLDIVSTLYHRALHSLLVLVVGLQQRRTLTVPELLLILEVVRHLKCHTVCAGQPPKSLSPATQALGNVVRGANSLVVFSDPHQTLRIANRDTPGVNASLYLIGNGRF